MLLCLDFRISFHFALFHSIFFAFRSDFVWTSPFVLEENLYAVLRVCLLCCVLRFDFYIYSIFKAFKRPTATSCDFFFFSVETAFLVFWGFVLFPSFFAFPRKRFRVDFLILLLCRESAFIIVGYLCACLSFDFDISCYFSCFEPRDAISSGLLLLLC